MDPSKIKALIPFVESKPYHRLARFLTLLYLVFLLSSCSVARVANPHKLESCKTHAYLRMPLDIYLSQRFTKNSPLRLGVIPFSSQANIASYSAQSPGLGNELAYRVRDLMLSYGAVPIVEILQRDDWPRKYEEFHAGNYGALFMGKSAHYDLILVGLIEPIHSLEALSAHTKLIETHQGITIWSGRSNVSTLRHEREKTRPFSWFIDRQPNQMYTRLLTENLAHCIVDGVLGEEPVPQ